MLKKSFLTVLIACCLLTALAGRLPVPAAGPAYASDEGGHHFTFENPVWSPDGKSIAYQRVDLIEGSMMAPFVPQDFEVWVMREDGSEKRRLCVFPWDKKFGEFVEILGWTDDGGSILVSHLKREADNVPGLDFELKQVNGLWIVPVSGDKKPFLWAKGYFRGRIIGSHGSAVATMDEVSFVSAGEGVYWKGLTLRSVDGRSLRTFPGVKLHTGYTPLFFNNSPISPDGALIAWTVDSDKADVVVQGLRDGYKKIIPPIRKKVEANVIEVITTDKFEWACGSKALLLHRYTGLGLFGLQSGRERAVPGVSPGPGTSISFSPDDRRLCFCRDNQVYSCPVAGGVRKIFENQKLRGEGAVMLWPFCWRKASPERILVCVQMGSFAQSERLTLGQYVICTISPDGKEVQYLTDLP